VQKDGGIAAPGCRSARVVPVIWWAALHGAPPLRMTGGAIGGVRRTRWCTLWCCAEWVPKRVFTSAENLVLTAQRAEVPTARPLKTLARMSAVMRPSWSP